MNELTLSKTVEKMNSSDYKDRFIAEYWQNELRRTSLLKIIIKAKQHQLDFNLKCPLSLLKKQYRAMRKYGLVLEKRAKMENINLYKMINEDLTK